VSCAAARCADCATVAREWQGVLHAEAERQRQRGMSASSQPHLPHTANIPTSWAGYFTTWSPFLSLDTPTRRYARLPEAERCRGVWGARKRALQCLQVLVESSSVPSVVLAVACRPGTQWQLASSLYPQVHFHLVDDVPLSVTSQGNVTVHSLAKLTTDDIVALAARIGIDPGVTLLYTDLYTAMPKATSEEAVEKANLRDMVAQTRWAHALRPAKTSMRLRLPYGKGKTELPRGRVYLPLWGPATTTECRLVIDRESLDAQYYAYDNTVVEQQLFFHNSVARRVAHIQYFDLPGMDHCFDCASELAIFARYVELTKANVRSQAAQVELVRALVGRLSVALANDVDALAKRHWGPPRHAAAQSKAAAKPTGGTAASAAAGTAATAASGTSGTAAAAAAAAAPAATDILERAPVSMKMEQVLVDEKEEKKRKREARAEEKHRRTVGALAAITDTLVALEAEADEDDL